MAADQVTTRMGTHNLVFSVHRLGFAPYAVFIENFVHEKRAGDPLHPGLPALISTTDPHDVDVLWDEMETHREEFAVGRALGKASNRSARCLEKQMRERMTDVLASATPPPVPSPGAASMPDRATLEQAGQTALQILTDPAQRQQIIDQYRTMGIDLD